ncbi:hypothetical protein PtA15_9A597 [Puccinia triticina]|uniref:Uncharacterized protein n=1 Tax=Puccinia triticina TaxID=208348 RepID=A0ABY7CUY4_9BASI|nr:uncharacterized protein PtA15_9A597 [Puccinia triticina]WAQ88470.1 hypothetical protein PtA15_9A597 [Puccinia triticina]
MSLMSGFEAQWEPRWASSRSGGPADQRGHLIDAVWASRSERVEDPAKRFWANFPAEAGSDRAIAQACFAEAQLPPFQIHAPIIPSQTLTRSSPSACLVTGSRDR